MTSSNDHRTLREELLDQLTDAILLVEEGRVLLASGRSAEQLGLPLNRIEGAAISDLLPEEVGEAIQRVRDGAASCTLRDIPWHRPGPIQRGTVRVTQGPRGEQLVLQISDSSDRAGHVATEGFRRRLSWLGSLAAGIAHEIRNPLGGIRGAAQLLRRDPGSDETDELTSMIIQESDRIDVMVEQLMGLTRPRQLQRSQVDINRLVHDEVALLSAQFGQSDVEWKLDLDPSLPQVEGDRLRLREAVGNLLRNAREAARSHVEVRTRVDAGMRLSEDGVQRGQVLRLDVTDDGLGIEDDQVPSLFAPFATTKPEGTGLGLFVTRQVIDDHQGLITVDPRPGQGACFSLLLPERLPQTEDTDSTPPIAHAPFVREVESRRDRHTLATETYR
ncbi:MAG: ATP-binding protein [Myxococcota bacterium]|nr:ATP-binding protein [Myxococcota bacterium]